MARRRGFSSNTIRSVGALLPYDVLAKAMEGEGLEGLASEDFSLEAGMRLRDVVNDAWNEAKADWWRFQSELQKLPADDATATALTRERWLLPLLRLLGFDAIEVVSGSLEVGGTGYPISHMNGATPLHLMGARANWTAASPESAVQLGCHRTHCCSSSSIAQTITCGVSWRMACASVFCATRSASHGRPTWSST